MHLFLLREGSNAYEKASISIWIHGARSSLTFWLQKFLEAIFYPYLGKMSPKYRWFSRRSHNTLMISHELAIKVHKEEVWGLRTSLGKQIFMARASLRLASLLGRHFFILSQKYDFLRRVWLHLALTWSEAHILMKATKIDQWTKKSMIFWFCGNKCCFSQHFGVRKFPWYSQKKTKYGQIWRFLDFFYIWSG